VGYGDEINIPLELLTLDLFKNIVEISSERRIFNEKDVIT
jgi:hypothetical protein